MLFYTKMDADHKNTNNVQKELKTRNYNVPTKVTKFKSPTAGIKNISVAVMVDGKRVPQITANGEAVLDKIQNLKKTYLG